MGCASTYHISSIREAKTRASWSLMPAGLQSEILFLKSNNNTATNSSNNLTQNHAGPSVLGILGTYTWASGRKSTTASTVG